MQSLSSFKKADFARAGQKARSGFSLSEGPIEGANGERIPHTIEPTLRKYGVPTRLNRGVIELLTDHDVRMLPANLNGVFHFSHGV